MKMKTKEYNNSRVKKSIRPPVLQRFCSTPPASITRPMVAIALVNNTTGSFNTAVGDNALFSNTTAEGNTANGASALSANTGGSFNTAIGGWCAQYEHHRSQQHGLGEWRRA